MYAYLSPLLMINQPDYLTVRLNQARGGYRCPLGSKADIASTNRIVDVAGLDFGVFLSPDFLNLAGCCCSTAAAASSRSTVMRTISEPARAKAATCFAVASASAVSVLVIDCTTIGAPPPTVCSGAPKLLVVALDGSLALRAIDRLAQSEGYTDIQNVMTVTNAP